MEKQWVEGQGLMVKDSDIQKETSVSAVALSDGLANLINAQDEYIKLLTMEIHEMSSYADIDGWESTKVEEGKRLREEIIRAREQVG